MGTGFPEVQALQGHLQGGWEKGAGRAGETAHAKAGRLGSEGQVGKPANNCVLRASASRGPDGGGKARGSDGEGLAWRGLCPAGAFIGQSLGNGKARKGHDRVRGGGEEAGRAGCTR